MRNICYFSHLVLGLTLVLSANAYATTSNTCPQSTTATACNSAIYEPKGDVGCYKCQWVPSTQNVNGGVCSPSSQTADHC